MTTATTRNKQTSVAKATVASALTLMMVAAAAPTATQAEDAAPKQDIVKLLTAYGKGWAERDVDAIVALHSDDTVFRLMVSGAEPARGKDELRAALEAIFTAAPNYSSTRTTLRIGEDFAVFEYEMHVEANLSPHIADMVFDASDEPYSIPALDIIEFKDGLVTEKVTYLDVETVRAKGK